MREYGTVQETRAVLVVTRALVGSYPTWTDENGANVEQVAALAVDALAAAGLLADSDTLILDALTRTSSGGAARRAGVTTSGR